MKLKYAFEITEIADEIVAVAIDEGADSFHGVIKLNETARFIFENLKEDISLPDLLVRCLDQYPESNIEEIGPFVLDYLNSLYKEGLLTI